MFKWKVFMVLAFGIIMGAVFFSCGSALDPFGGTDYVCWDLGSNDYCTYTKQCVDMNSSGNENDYYEADGVKFYERDYGMDQWAAEAAMNDYCSNP